ARRARYGEEWGLLRSRSVPADRGTYARSHHAAASPRAPVNPLNRASPISLSRRDRHVFPHTVSRADGSRVVTLWSGQRSWRQAAAANSTRADWSLPRSSVWSL